MQVFNSSSSVAAFPSALDSIVLWSLSKKMTTLSPQQRKAGRAPFNNCKLHSQWHFKKKLWKDDEKGDVYIRVYNSVHLCRKLTELSGALDLIPKKMLQSTWQFECRSSLQVQAAVSFLVAIPWAQDKMQLL